MAKSKITVKFHGKTIGTRTTDRLYTHAVVLTDFNPTVARDRDHVDWMAFGKANARSIHKYATEAQHPTYRYASVMSDPERARCAKIAALTLEQHFASEHLDRLNRLEKRIAERVSEGPAVLSYHGSLDLAVKAQAAAIKGHPGYTAVVVPIE